MDQTLDFDNELKLLRSRLKQREDKIETWLMEGTKQIVEVQTHKHAESLQKGLGTISQEMGIYNLSCVMRKPALCICENKGTDQLGGDHTDDQRPCFCYIDTCSTHTLFQNFKLLAIFCGGTAWFVSNLVGNSKGRFFLDALI